MSSFKATETVKIGPDRVMIGEDRVVIDSKHPMNEWQVREFSPMPIYFRDNKYLLLQKIAGEKPYAARYILGPWPEGTSQGNRTFNYDEETIAQREGKLRSRHVDDVGRAALLLLYPFLGLLWSEPKEKLRRFGFDPRSTTAISIFLVFGLILVDMVFLKMMIFKSLKTGEVMIGGMLQAFTGADYVALGVVEFRMLWLDAALVVLLLADLVVRYSQHMREEEPFWGFAEWLFGRKPRKKMKVEAARPAIVTKQEKAPEEAPEPIRMPGR